MLQCCQCLLQASYGCYHACVGLQAMDVYGCFKCVGLQAMDVTAGYGCFKCVLSWGVTGARMSS